MTRCFLKEGTQGQECLTGPPTSQQLPGAGPLSVEDKTESQAAGLRGHFQALSCWVAGLLCSLLKMPRGLQTLGCWAWPMRYQQHVHSQFGPKWAWLCAPCPQPCLAEAVPLDK